MSASVEHSSLSVLWYPKESHVKIEINCTCYSIWMGDITEERRYQQLREKALEGGANYYRFTLNVADEEVQVLEAFLNPSDEFAGAPQLFPDYCSGTIGKLLNDFCSGVTVSFWDSRSPALLANTLKSCPATTAIHHIAKRRFGGETKVASKEVNALSWVAHDLIPCL